MRKKAGFYLLEQLKNLPEGMFLQSFQTTVQPFSSYPHNIRYCIQYILLLHYLSSEVGRVHCSIFLTLLTVQNPSGRLEIN